jgi:hypothetical protein
MIFDAIATVPEPTRKAVLAFRWNCPACGKWGRVTLACSERPKAIIHKAVKHHQQASPTCRADFQSLQLRQERLEEGRP